MKQYSITQLKAMAFDAARQIHLLKEEQNKIIKELMERNAIVMGAELTPDDVEEEKK